MMSDGRRSGAVLLMIGLGWSLLTSCAGGDVPSTQAREVTTVKAEYFVNEYGVRVGIRVGFPEARKVTGARLVAADETVDLSLYPLDGTDPDRTPETLSPARGERVLLEGSLLDLCSGATETPVFEVDYELNGENRNDYFGPANHAGYQRAVDQWCDRALTMMVTGSSVTLAGVYELNVEFSNPGPDPEDVTSAQVDDGSTSWQEVAVVVPGGSIEQMTIRGEGPPECAATPPRESGHVRSEGKVLLPISDGWC